VSDELWWCDCPCWCEYTSPGHEMPIPPDAEVTHTKIRVDDRCPDCGAAHSVDRELDLSRVAVAEEEK
jgi:hypothetical protein